VLILLRCLLLLLLTAFGPPAASQIHSPESSPGRTHTVEAPGDCRKVPTQSFEIVRSYPHDPNAFTQGLLYHQGFLYESTGLYGGSSLRKVEIESGKVIHSIQLAPAFFGEGLALRDGRLIQLTWQSHLGFVYDLDSFRLIQQFRYRTDGWGLTQDGESLIMTDGSEALIFLDPTTFEEKRRVEVHCGDSPVRQLNELEIVRGELLANIFGKDVVARISPENGAVLGWIDLAGLRGALGPVRGADVLNGIAYDPDHDRLFVTGKHWPKLFEIRLKKP
jgi:glutaminyl-peptide cyclotransferase